MNIQKKLISAYLWAILGKWVARSIGIVSTVILARMLEPASFGLIALAMICIGFFEMLQTIGIDRYLIIQTKLNDDLLNTGWTLQIICKFTLYALLLLCSSHFAAFFDKPELELLIDIIAINSFFASFQNIGLTKFQRDLAFKKPTYLGIAVKLSSTVTTLVFAYFNPSHWALVAGGVVSLWVNLIGSYIICDYRPRLNFNFERKMFSFSFYIWVRNVFAYSRSKADAFIVSKFFDSTAVGMYKIGSDFALLPLSEIIYPAGQAIFPGLAKFKDDKAELFDKTYKYLALIYLFVLPSMVGIWFIALQFCTVILGDKWVNTAPIMSALAVLMLSYPLNAVVTNLFDYLGKAKYSIFNDIFGLGAIGLTVVSFSFDSIHQFSLLRGYIGIAVLLFVVAFARLTIQLSVSKIVELMLPSALAAALMYLSFVYIYSNASMTLLGLLANVLFGALTYAVYFSLLVVAVKPHSAIWQFWYDRFVAVFHAALNKYTKLGAVNK